MHQTQFSSEPAPAKLSHRDLARAIAAGSKSAEQEFYACSLKLAHKEAHAWLRDAHEAQDLAHEALICVLCRLRNGTIADPSRLDGFTRRTVRYMAIAYLRGHRVSKTTYTDEVPEAAQLSHEDGFARLAEWETRQSLSHLIQHLSVERDRSLLKRHYLEEQPKEELCAQMNLQPDQFDRVVYRARQRLRQVVDSFAPDLKQEMYC